MAKNSGKKKRPAASKPGTSKSRRANKRKSVKKKSSVKKKAPVKRKKAATKQRAIQKKRGATQRNTKAARPTRPLTKAQTDKTYTGHLDSSVLAGIAPHTSRREIYYRLEWYFLGNYVPDKPHRIVPTAPISSLSHGLSLQDLCYNMNTEENRPKYFNGVKILWDSPPPPTSFRNIKNFGELLDSVVADYRIAGFVIDGE